MKTELRFSLRTILFNILILISFISFSQADSNFAKVQVLNIETGELSPLDTSINEMVDYIQLFEKDINYIHARNGVYLPLTYQNNRWLTTSPFMFEEINLPQNIYRTQLPYTSIEGLIGSNSEEYLDFLHTQNVLPNWNIGMRYRFQRDEGSYFASTTRKWRTQLYSHYESTNGKYSNHFEFNANQGRHSENFGVDSLNLLQDIIQSSELLGVDNQIAVHENRNFYLNLNHRYRLNSDSSKTKIYLDQHLKFTRRSHTFEDNVNSTDFSLYNKFITDSSFIFDSVKTQVYEIPLSLLFKGKSLEFKTGLSYNYHQYFSHDSVWVPHQYTFDQLTSINQLKWNKRRFKLHTNFNYVLWGMNQGNFESSNRLDYKLNLLNVFGEVNFHSTSVLPYWQRFNNANYEWDLNLDPELEISFTGGIQNKLFIARLDHHVIDNVVYFNDTTLTQSYSTINYSKAELATRFDYEKWGIKTRLVYQKSTDSIVSVPDLIGKLWLYKKGGLFKKKMQIEVGLILSYYTAYNAPHYLPNMGIFVPQTTYTMGAYPLIDFYFSGKVKNARFFLKGEHLNQGFTGYNYYASYRNPLAGRTLKFGIILGLYN